MATDLPLVKTQRYYYGLQGSYHVQFLLPLPYLPCLIKRFELFLPLHSQHVLWTLLRVTLSLALTPFISVTPSHHSHLLTWN